MKFITLCSALLGFITTSLNSHPNTPTIDISSNTITSPTQMEQFLFAIGHSESSNRYDIVNKFGYLGRYQFGMSTLETLKIKTTKQEFLKNHKLQETAMQLLLSRNKRLLSKIIKTHSNTTIRGITITESGILAAAHLGGPNSVKSYFTKGTNSHDSYNTSIVDYLIKFSGYELYNNQII